MQNDLVSKNSILKGLQFGTAKEAYYTKTKKEETQITPTQMQLNSSIINAITPTVYASCLDMNKALKIATTPTENAVLTLSIDQRPYADFNEEHIDNSVNISLTPIIRRRFNDNILTQFQFLNFITSTAGKSLFAQFVTDYWKIRETNASVKVLFLVYMEETPEESDDAWLLLSVLRQGLAGDLFGDNGPLINFGFLKGGFNAFIDHPRYTEFIDSTSQAISPISSISGISPQIQQLPFLASNNSSPGYASPRGRFLSLHISSPDSIPGSPRKKKASIGGIGLNIPSKMPTNVGQLTNLGIASENPTEDMLMSPSTPPMSAVCSPYTLIRPYMYLGSDALPSSATSVDELKALKVTHILNVAADVCIPDSLKESFDVLWIKLQDNLEQEIYPDIKRACQYIDQARKENPEAVVFVHCKAGKSRSATVVVAYLMWLEGTNQSDAYDEVKCMRPEVSPNLGFVMALTRFQEENNKNGPKTMEEE